MDKEKALTILREFIADFEFPLDNKVKQIYIGNDELEAIKILTKDE